MSVRVQRTRAHGSLSSWDDYPVHQAAETIRHATHQRPQLLRPLLLQLPFQRRRGAADLRHGPVPEPGRAGRLRRRGVGHRPRVVRASRELGDRMDTSVGPFRVEVDPSARGAADRPARTTSTAWPSTSRWNGSIPAFEEPRQYVRKHGRVYFDTMRLAQTGRWSGTIESSGRTFDVTPDRWWGTRDRSWGVRPVGEEEPAGHPHRAARWTVSGTTRPMQFDDHSILYILNEHDNGRPRSSRRPSASGHDPDREPEWLGRPEHEHVVTPGRGRIESARDPLPRRARGAARDLRRAAARRATSMYGTGYGMEDDWRHGMYQGPLVVQGQTDELRRDPRVAVRHQRPGRPLRAVERTPSATACTSSSSSAGSTATGSTSGTRRRDRPGADPPPASTTRSERGDFTLKSGAVQQLVHRLEADGLRSRRGSADGRCRARRDPARRDGDRWPHRRCRSRGLRRRGGGRDPGRRLRSFTIRKEAKDHGVTGESPGRCGPATRWSSPRTPSRAARRWSRRSRSSASSAPRSVLIMPLVDRGGTCAAMAAEAGVAVPTAGHRARPGLRLRGGA